MTEKGAEIAYKLGHRNIVLHNFFHTILQLPEAKAKDIACRLEHIIPDDVMLRWRQFVLYMNHTDSWHTWQEHTTPWRAEHLRLHQTLETSHTDHPNQPGTDLPEQAGSDS